MDINLVIAENCRRIRKTEKLSLEKAAELAGISRSMLGQIERGEANPSAALLYKLALALKVPVEELLAHEPAWDNELLRAVDRTAERLSSGRVQLHRLIPYSSDSAFEESRIDLFIGAEYSLPPQKSGTVGYLVLTAGRLKVRVGTEEFSLEEWDVLHFHADQPCVLENSNTTSARAVIGYHYQK